jgi:DNA-binding response OmpR family regulator
MSGVKILLMEEDDSQVSPLPEILMEHHYLVTTTASSKTGLDLATSLNYDLIVLDIVVSQLEGLKVCRQLRKAGSQVPILVVAAHDSQTDQVMGLEAGADDYIVKPFEVTELIARIRALLRRGKAFLPTVLTWETLQLNLDTSEVSYDGRILSLTPKTLKLLELFLRHPQRIFSRRAILDRIWPEDEFPGEEAVNTHIKVLRQKLKAVGLPKDPIETVYGLGYRLKPEASPQASPAATADEAALATILAEARQQMQVQAQDLLRHLETLIPSFSNGTLNPEQRHHILQGVHRLVGGLGSVGLPMGSEVCRRIEQLLQPATSSDPSQVVKLVELMSLLQQSVQAPAEAMKGADPCPIVATSRRLLVIDDDVALAELIRVEAGILGVQVEVATDLSTARLAIKHRPPDVILLDLSFSTTLENGLTLLAELEHATIPVVVMTGANQLKDRIAVSRLGGKAFLQKPVSAQRIFQVVSRILDKQRPADSRVLVVDDDPLILTLVTSILTPWGLQVTTLSDPDQFWQVLEAVAPNLLVLDIEMPNFNGLDLCRVVRQDPSWCDIGVVVLSAHTDAATVRQVYTVGADDYVSKPIVDAELVARLLNRLERVRTRR